MNDQEPEDGKVAKWVSEIQLYDKEAQPWMTKSDRIVKRYKDERGVRDVKARYNILWSNVQTLLPALYASLPKPNIDRRFQDDDDLGRISAQVLERSVTYFVQTELFDSVMNQAVLDRLLPGRGTAWVRYVPNFKDATVQGSEEVREDGTAISDDAEIDEGPNQELSYEEVIVDFVHCADFGHTYARTWEETRAVWKKVYMTRTELVSRFGEIGNDIPLDYTPEKDSVSNTGDHMKKATVYEIWDKPSKKAIWLHKDYPNLLDERDDPLKLKDFFPCPKPIYATLANDSLVPIPDYEEYRDQANELDELTGRIRSITKAIKVAGVYDASAEGVQRLLAEGVENQLIPVEQWAVFGDKGGLKGVINFLPMQEIIQTLQSLYEARESVKQIIYEITGISDIIRGSSNPNETATAQELKGQYATLRLNSQQKDVARFSRDLVRIMTEIIAEHFSMETIKQLCGVKLLSQAEKQQITMQQQLAQQQGQQAPIPEDVQELMDLPSWEDVEKLIRNDTARCFRIDIETDSTIKVDQESEKKARIEFITAAGSFIQQAAQVQNPELQPLLMEMLLFGARGFKIGREMETTFKTVMDKMRKGAEQPQQPQPDPAAEAAQMQMQVEGQRLQLDGQKIQSDAQSNAAELDIKRMEVQIKQQELEIKRMDLALKQQDMQQKSDIEGKKIEADLIKTAMMGQEKGESEDVAGIIEQTIGQAMDRIAMAQNGSQEIVAALSKPKTIKIIRDEKGMAIGGVSE